MIDIQIKTIVANDLQKNRITKDRRGDLQLTNEKQRSNVLPSSYYITVIVLKLHTDLLFI